LNHFTQIFVNMKKEYNSRKKAPSEDAFKKYLSDSYINLENISNTTSLRKRNTTNIPSITISKPITDVPNINLNIKNPPLFATYSNHNTLPYTNPNEGLGTPVKIFKSYYANQEDPFAMVNDKLNKPPVFLFDNKLDKILGKKSHRSRSKLDIPLPEFLKNKIPPVEVKQRKESEADVLASYLAFTPTKNKKKQSSVVNIKSRKTSKEFIDIRQVREVREVREIGEIREIKEIKEVKERKRSVNAIPIRIPLTDSSIKTSKVKIKKNKPRKNPHFEFSEIPGDPNSHIIDINSNVISISKEIFNYADYYEKIVIEKSRLNEIIEIKQEENLEVKAEDEENLGIDKKEEIESNMKEYEEQEVEIELLEAGVNIVKSEMDIEKEETKQLDDSELPLVLKIENSHQGENIKFVEKNLEEEKLVEEKLNDEIIADEIKAVEIYNEMIVEEIKLDTNIFLENNFHENNIEDNNVRDTMKVEDS
jgi:hypothetical protein